MSIEKKSLINTLKTTKKANVARAKAGVKKADKVVLPGKSGAIPGRAFHHTARLWE